MSEFMDRVDWINTCHLFKNLGVLIERYPGDKKLQKRYKETEKHKNFLEKKLKIR